MTNAYANAARKEQDITGLMREINALEVGTPGCMASTIIYLTGTLEYHYMACYAENIYIATRSLYSVDVYDLAGNVVRSWSTGTLSTWCMCSGDGEIFLYGVDRITLQYKVIVYSTTGTVLRSWNVADSSYIMERMAVYDNELYTVDKTDHLVRVWSLSGAPHRTIGTGLAGDAEGDLKTATGIVIYDAELYVLDSGNNRVQVFTPAGAFTRRFDAYNMNLSITEKEGNIYLGRIYGGSYSVLPLTTDGTYLRAPVVLEKEPSDMAKINDRLVVLSSGAFDTHRITLYDLQSTFYAYGASNKVSLGTPDGGVSVPALNGLTSNNAIVAANHITDMRTAIQAIVAAGHYKNPATHVAYNWTNGSPNNLYYVAMGDRTKYGATGGAGYTWTRTLAQMANTYTYDIDIGEIYECVETLKNAET